jgi:hypothetical protein
MLENKVVVLGLAIVIFVADKVVVVLRYTGSSLVLLVETVVVAGDWVVVA